MCSRGGDPPIFATNEKSTADQDDNQNDDDSTRLCLEVVNWTANFNCTHIPHLDRANHMSLIWTEPKQEPKPKPGYCNISVHCEPNAKVQLPKSMAGCIRESCRPTALFLCGVWACGFKLQLLSMLFSIMAALTVMVLEKKTQTVFLCWKKISQPTKAMLVGALSNLVKGVLAHGSRVRTRISLRSLITSNPSHCMILWSLTEWCT